MPNAAAIAAAVRADSAASLCTALVPDGCVIAGSGARAIAAAARAVRSTPSISNLRVALSCERSVSIRSAWSGMILSTVPPLNAPTVTTPNALGSFSRLITLCTSVTKWLPMTIGSMLLSGIEPCAPTPLKVIRILSKAEVTTPSLTIT